MNARAFQPLCMSGFLICCRELAETILDSGDTLLTILGDILDFSKIDHNSMVLESAPVSSQTPPEGSCFLIALHLVPIPLAHCLALTLSFFSGW